METRAVLLHALHDDPADRMTWDALADNLEEEGHRSAVLFRDQLALQRATDAGRSEAERRVRDHLASGITPFMPTLTVALTRRVALDAVLLPPGTFWMGSDEEEPGGDGDEKPRHEVTLTRPFYMGVVPVTQRQWFAVLRRRPARFTNALHPVERVALEDCEAFCAKVSEISGRVVRLPTEAEWEYACRAGTTTMYAGGTRPADMGRLGWCDDRRTHPVGTKQPNGWGLYDMHGNVWEWCADHYDLYPEETQTDPVVLGNEGLRVARGGSHSNTASVCRSACRIGFMAGGRNDFIGCRVVVEWSRGRGVG